MTCNGRRSVSSCKYHFVGCPSYRHPVPDMIEDDVRELFGEKADHFEHEILALEIADDLVQVFVQPDPKHSPADIARQLKSYSGNHLSERYPRFRSRISVVVGSGRLGTTCGRRDGVGGSS